MSITAKDGGTQILRLDLNRDATSAEPDKETHRSQVEPRHCAHLTT